MKISPPGSIANPIPMMPFSTGVVFSKELGPMCGMNLASFRDPTFIMSYSFRPKDCWGTIVGMAHALKTMGCPKSKELYYWLKENIGMRVNDDEEDLPWEDKP